MFDITFSGITAKCGCVRSANSSQEARSIARQANLIHPGTTCFEGFCTGTEPEEMCFGRKVSVRLRCSEKEVVGFQYAEGHVCDLFLVPNVYRLISWQLAATSSNWDLLEAIRRQGLSIEVCLKLKMKRKDSFYQNIAKPTS